MPYTPNTLASQGNWWKSVYIDTAPGTVLSHALTDASTTYVGTSQNTHNPTSLVAYQEVLARYILVGCNNGLAAQSTDDGATFLTIDLGTSAYIESVCCDPTQSATDYPHAYLGDSNGYLYSLTDLIGGGIAITKYPDPFPSGIASLTQPRNSHGAIWIADDNNTLWFFTPITQTRILMAEFSSNIAALGNLGSATTVYGVGGMGTGLFKAVYGSQGATVFQLDNSQDYHSISCAGTRGILAGGEHTIAWSPDAGSSLGFITPLTPGPYYYCTLSALNHNEWAALAGDFTTILTTQDNGQTWLPNVALSSGSFGLAYDNLYPGVGYILDSGISVSYDNMQSQLDLTTPDDADSMAIGPLVIPTPSSGTISSDTFVFEMETLIGFSWPSAPFTFALDVDSLGNVYASPGQGGTGVFDGSIKKIDTLGVLTTFAGNELSGFSQPSASGSAAEGMGLDARLATFATANSLVFDSSDNMYVADGSSLGNNVLWKIDHSTRIATIIAGSPNVTAYAGDGGLASACTFYNLNGLAMDKSGNKLYLVDVDTATFIGTIRVIDFATGHINAVAGEHATPSDTTVIGNALAFDPGSGHLYIEYKNTDIGQVDTTAHTITSWLTLSGTNNYAIHGAYLYAGGDIAQVTKIDLATKAIISLIGPSSGNDKNVFASSTNLYVAEYSVPQLLAYDLGTLAATPIMGNGLQTNRLAFGGEGGQAYIAPNSGDGISPGKYISQGQLSLCMSPTDEIYWLEYIASTAQIMALRNSDHLAHQVHGMTALGANVSSIQFTATGDLYLGQYSSPVLSLVDEAMGTLTAIPSLDPLLTEVDYIHPGKSGDAALYVSGAYNGAYYPLKVDPGTGGVTIIAGTSTPGFSGDGGLATSAQIMGHIVCMDSHGNLFLMDGGNSRIRRIDALTGIITTVAGTGTPGFNGDGIGVQIGNPNLCFMDQTSNVLYFYDTGASYNAWRLRYYNTNTLAVVTISDTCGVQGQLGEGNNVPGGAALVGNLQDITTDSSGNVYFNEYPTGWIRKLFKQTSVAILPLSNMLLPNATRPRSTLIIDWLGVPGATAYTLNVSPHPTFDYLVVNVSGIAATSYDMTTSSLPAQPVYWWRVKADDGPNTSWSVPYWYNTTISTFHPMLAASASASGSLRTISSRILSLNAASKHASGSLSTKGIPHMTYPLDGDTNIPVSLIFTWESPSDASAWHMEITDTPTWGHVIFGASTGVTHFPFYQLNINTTYYVRVRNDSPFNAPVSPTVAYATQASYYAGDFGGGSLVTLADVPFNSSQDFSVGGWFKTLTTGAMIMADGGQASPSAIGWSIGTNSSGHLIASVSDGTHVVSTTMGFVADGNPHLVEIFNFPDDISGPRVWFYLDNYTSPNQVSSALSGSINGMGAHTHFGATWVGQLWGWAAWNAGVANAGSGFNDWHSQGYPNGVFPTGTAPNHFWPFDEESGVVIHDILDATYDGTSTGAWTTR